MQCTLTLLGGALFTTSLVHATDAPKKDERFQSADVPLGPTPPKRDTIPTGGGNPLTLSQPASATANFAWQGAQVNLNVDPIQCNGVNIGRIDFQYRRFTDRVDHDGMPGTPLRDMGGAAMEGGFTHNGGNHCAPNAIKAGTTYRWVQMINTNVPLQAPPPGETTYLDTNAIPWLSPWYPFASDNNNPAGAPFTGQSFYDGPRRFEQPGVVTWDATLMLVCTHGWKINVIGNVEWGYDIAGDPAAGGQTNGATAVVADAPAAWAGGAPAAILRSLRKSVAPPFPFNMFTAGFSIANGCCCTRAAARPGQSDAGGLSSLPLDFNMANVDDVVIFPRNRQPVDFEFCPEGWQCQPWLDGQSAPQLPYMDQPDLLMTQGLHYQYLGTEPLDGTVDFPMLLQGHESFFDIYVHLADEDIWMHLITQSQQLIGDMNGDEVLDEFDLPMMELAIVDPAAWQDMFPWLDLMAAGDLNHDDLFNDIDLDLMFQLQSIEYVADAEDLGFVTLCPEDIDGSGDVGIGDLLAVLAAWGICDAGCVEDIDNDGMVGITDLLAVLGAWGECAG